MDNALEFTNQFLCAIEEARVELGLSHSEIARRAFTKQSDPVGTYRKLRNSGRHLKLADAFCLALAVEQDFASLCWRVSQSSQA